MLISVPSELRLVVQWDDRCQDAAVVVVVVDDAAGVVAAARKNWWEIDGRRLTQQQGRRVELGGN